MVIKFKYRNTPYRYNTYFTIFRCEKDYGIFVPANKVMKAGKGYRPNPPQIKKEPKVTTVNFGKVRISARGIDVLLNIICVKIHYKTF